jgi:hypothetical protein
MNGRTATLLLALATAAPALAEEPQPPPAPTPNAPAAAASQTRVGLGVSLGSGTAVGFSVPVQIGPHLRIEPEIAIIDHHVASEEASKMAGMGLAWTFPVAAQLQGSAGLRFQATFFGNGNIRSYRGAALLGGEWLPVPRVSIGVEAQVGYTSFWHSWSGPGPFRDGLDTTGLFIARVYIW